MSIFGRIFGAARLSVDQRKQIYIDLDATFVNQLGRQPLEVARTARAFETLANQALEHAAQLVAAKHGISRQQVVEIYNEGKKSRWPAR
jgi:hypothetical protein